MPTESFAHLLTSLRHEGSQAALTLFERYTRRLIGLVRKRLDDRLQGRVDADDVIQSVYGSFFRRFERGEFDIEGWDSLWALLAQIAIFKCNRQIAYHQAKKRDVRREDHSPEPTGEELARIEVQFGQEPDPAEVVALAELVESMQKQLSDDHRRIIALRLQGFSPAEISAETGLSERSVHRLIRLVKDHLSAMLEAAHA